jgi:hypothetical protein
MRQHIKILFLDIDGVCNHQKTRQRQGDSSFIGINPVMAARVRRIITETNCKVVLSSSWRLFPDSKKWAEQEVCEFYDVTADPNRGAIWGMVYRGFEIKEWLGRHPGARRYAILDDSDDFLWGQHLFRTTWAEGLTDEIADAVIAHLNA